jgi:hypothetical protein
MFEMPIADSFRHLNDNIQQQKDLFLTGLLTIRLTDDFPSLRLEFFQRDERTFVSLHMDYCRAFSPAFVNSFNRY